MRVRVSATVLAWLEQSAAWTDTEHETDAATRRLFSEMQQTGRRSDGSITLDLYAEGLDELRDWATFLEHAAHDGAGSDPSSRGEYNAARALIRQIDRGRSKSW